MKKIAVLSVIFILLAVLVVPVMAKSPRGNQGAGNPGMGTGGVVTAGNSNHGIGQGQGDNNGNSHGKNGNHGNRGNGNQNNANRGMPFYLQGTIKSIDLTAKTITVTVVHGNARVKEFIGGDITLQTTDGTQYFKINQLEGNNESEGPNRVAITFDKLAAGDIVAIHGYLVDGVYTARLVTVYVRAPEVQPEGAPSDSQG